VKEPRFGGTRTEISIASTVGARIKRNQRK
jgi:hypothetical protein